MSAPKIAQEVAVECKKQVHPSTIRRILRREGLHGRIARKKPFINDRNRKRRLQFAREYVLKEDMWWEDCLFSDESKFNVFGADGAVRVWRKKNEELRTRNLRPTVKHGGGSVMVWGCMAASGVGQLVFVEGIMKKEGYLKILQNNVRQSAEKLGIRDTFKFYQDNDPKHAARVCQEWALYNLPKVLHPPAQSPDFNVIENLWDHLDQKVHERPVSSVTELRRRLVDEWEKITPEYCRTLVSSMSRRLQAAIDANGGPTKY